MITNTVNRSSEDRDRRWEESRARDRRIRERIERAREILKPTPVRINRCPNWFRIALIRAFGSVDGYTHSALVVPKHLRRFGWFDHWGVTETEDGLTAFVCEPYGIDEEDLRSAARLARQLQCDWRFSGNSWWYPGSTVRIAFTPLAEVAK